ncbi:MAG: nuclear transport factor 2 family protein [Blastocatellia bacterium]|nr:nuclear transport factor 2 family protein [Blastocatellia bacterium]
MTNLEIVQNLYLKFATGDIPAVLAALTEDVEWVMPGGAVLPFAGIWRGPQEVAHMFGKLAAALTFEVFEPQEFISQGNTVVVIGRSRDRLQADNRVVELDWVAVIRLRDGKVARYQVYEDTAVLVPQS